MFESSQEQHDSTYFSRCVCQHGQPCRHECVNIRYRMRRARAYNFYNEMIDLWFDLGVIAFFVVDVVVIVVAAAAATVAAALVGR